MDEEKRRGRIGGSDIGHILGYGDAFNLWAEKTGRLERQPPDRHMMLGKCLEQGIIKFYEWKTGRKTHWCDKTLQHPTYPWVCFTPDALCVNERRGVDAKWVSWYQRNEWGPTSTDIPPRVQLQAQWYLMASDYEFWDVAALIGDDLYIYQFNRDPELEAKILAQSKRWYERYLVGDEQPPLGLTDTSEKWIIKQFPRPSGNIREATHVERAMLEKYSHIYAEAKALMGERKECEVWLKTAIGNDIGIRWEHGEFTWKRTKDKSEVDWEGLARHLLVGFTKEEEEGEIRDYTETRPGTRRMRFISDIVASEDE